MERTITIRGKADILVVPDHTKLMLVLKEQDKNHKKAYEKLQKKTDTVTECACSSGIEKENVKTTNYYAQAQKKLIKNLAGNFANVDDGYLCCQTVSIEFDTDPVLLAERIEKLTTSMENPELSISFSVQDKKRYEEELLNKVTQDAMSKAKLFCAPSHATIGKLISVNYQRGLSWNFAPPMQFRVPDQSRGMTCELNPSMSPFQAPALSAPKPVFDPPTRPAPPAPDVGSIIPQEQRIVEEAIFVWEIVDNNQGE